MFTSETALLNINKVENLSWVDGLDGRAIAHKGQTQLPIICGLSVYASGHPISICDHDKIIKTSNHFTWMYIINFKTSKN